ncbi:hypothetical protein ACLOJK_026902, partial [Asimina triloba]
LSIAAMKIANDTLETSPVATVQAFTLEKMLPYVVFELMKTLLARSFVCCSLNAPVHV